MVVWPRTNIWYRTVLVCPQLTLKQESKVKFDTCKRFAGHDFLYILFIFWSPRNNYKGDTRPFQYDDPWLQKLALQSWICSKLGKAGLFQIFTQPQSQSKWTGPQQLWGKNVQINWPNITSDIKSHPGKENIFLERFYYIQMKLTYKSRKK